MMGPTVDILVPEMGQRDATSSHTRLLREMLVQRGVSAQIVVGRVTPHDDHDLPMRRWRADADLTILKHTIGSQIAQRVIGKRMPVVVNYHNVTPPHFVEAWRPGLAAGLRWGRTQLHQLAPLTRRGIADSAFNARDLADAGIGDVVVAPVLWRFGEDGPSRCRGPVTGRAGSPTLLFVGRIAPNKCHHDLIAALAALSGRRPRAKLVMVGSAAPRDYRPALEALSERLGMVDRVIFTGEVTDLELGEWYRRAGLFVCASEHEGFCVPLIEAMASGVPVIAYDAAAVAETVGSAGLVLSDKRPLTLAAAIDLVLTDGALRDRFRDRGVRRAERFGIAITGDEMWDALADLISEAEFRSKGRGEDRLPAKRRLRSGRPLRAS